MIQKLNLAVPALSQIKYKISQFPDGQQDVTITDLDFTQEENEIEISSRFNSFRDLELIICATKALRNVGTKKISLYVPYLLGARSDRKFSPGGTSYLRDIVAPILNAQNYEHIICIDVHSHVAAACINNLLSLSNHNLVEMVLTGLGHTRDLVNVVAPDDGASKKIYNLCNKFDLGYPCVCSKERELETGKIMRTIVPEFDFNKNPPLIIDDICDGGRTFIEIMKAIKSDQPETPNGYLIVTHGIFSAGFNELMKYFDRIYCTNSVSVIDNAGFVKQLNVF